MKGKSSNKHTGRRNLHTTRKKYTKDIWEDKSYNEVNLESAFQKGYDKRAMIHMKY